MAIGQAGGLLDLIVDFSLKKNSSLTLDKAGYINKIIMCDNGNEIVMACERGLFIANYSAESQRLFLDKEEFYLENCLVSQVFEYDMGRLVATVFHETSYYFIDRHDKPVGEAKGSVETMNE